MVSFAFRTTISQFPGSRKVATGETSSQRGGRRVRGQEKGRHYGLTTYILTAEDDSFYHNEAVTKTSDNRGRLRPFLFENRPRNLTSGANSDFRRIHYTRSARYSFARIAKESPQMRIETVRPRSKKGASFSRPLGQYENVIPI